METNLSQTLDITKEKAKYDQYIKEILADKQVLARILKYTLEEFEDMEIPAIIDNIDEPEISKIRIEPGHTNIERITGTPTEDSVPGEGMIYFDIRFSAYSGEELIKILVNIEAQKSSDHSKLGYYLDNRILYYLGRMISAQKEVEFSKSDYDNLKAVRSIWICMDAGDNDDSINRIRFTQETIFGNKMDLANIDKVQGVIIRLRSNDEAEESKNALIAMLEELIRKEDVDEKKKHLAHSYGLNMSSDDERRFAEMCNLSEVVFEKGEEKGLVKGVERGKILARFEDGMSPEEIAVKTNVSIDKVKEVLAQEQAQAQA